MVIFFNVSANLKLKVKRQFFFLENIRFPLGLFMMDCVQI